MKPVEVTGPGKYAEIPRDEAHAIYSAYAALKGKAISFDKFVEGGIPFKIVNMFREFAMEPEAKLASQIAFLKREVTTEYDAGAVNGLIAALATISGNRFPVYVDMPKKKNGSKKKGKSTKKKG